MLFLDTETTGFHDDDEILSISIINAQGKTLLDTFVKLEHKRSWPEAEKVNGLFSFCAALTRPRRSW